MLRNLPESSPKERVSVSSSEHIDEKIPGTMFFIKQRGNFGEGVEREHDDLLMRI